MAWSHPYLSHLTSAATLYKGAKGKDAKANILAETVNKIMAKAPEDTRALPYDLKKVCLNACVSLLHSQLTVATANRNTDLVPQLQQVASLCQSHPTNGNFFQRPTATWSQQVPQDISSERRSRCAIWREGVRTGIKAVKCSSRDTRISGCIPRGFDHNP